MIDQAKRDTLKNVAAIGVSAIAITASSGVLARTTPSADPSMSLTPTSCNEGLVHIQISTRQHPITNNLEVLITNTSQSAAIISHMTPAEINTVRGRFDFNALFDTGELHLAAGESVTVPMQHHAVVLDGSSIEERAAELTNSLRRNVSIISEGNSFAVTSVANFKSFA